MVSFMPQPYYYWGRSPWYPLDRRLGRPQNITDSMLRYIFSQICLFNIALTDMLIIKYSGSIKFLKNHVFISEQQVQL
jgi:hypothetical protein